MAQMGPMNKYVIADPGVYELNGAIIENAYQSVVNNRRVQVTDTRWSSMYWNVSLNNNTLPRKAYLKYTGKIYGEACIIFLDMTDSIISYYKAPANEIVTTTKILLPRSTRSIYVSCEHTATLHAILLDFEDYDCTEDVENWRELDTYLFRSGVSGLFVGFSMPVSFVRKARIFVKNLFDGNLMNAKASLKVYRRDDHNFETYYLRNTFRLEFNTYKESDLRAEMSASTTIYEDYLKAYGAVTWDLPVKDITASRKWNYNRLDWINFGRYTIAEASSGNAFRNPYKLQVNLDAAEMAYGSPEHDIKTQRSGSNLNDYFFQASGDSAVKINLKMKLKIRCVASGEHQANVIPTQGNCNLNIYKDNIIHRSYPIKFTQFTDGGIWVYSYESVIDEQGIEISLSPGNKLTLAVQYTDSNQYLTGSYFFISEFEAFEFTYRSKGPSITEIDVISPATLLQTLLDKMAPGAFTSSINWGNAGVVPMLCAADSIRGFPLESTDSAPQATMHASMDDFMEWMRDNGYEYEQVGNSINYKPLASFYNKNLTAMEIPEGEITNLSIEADTQFAFSNIKIGYEKQDYDSVNGKYEPMGTLQYTTDHYQNNDIYGHASNDLEKISPYRADPIGIELLFWTRGELSKDTKSDNDIFCIAMKTNPFGYYEVSTAIEMAAGRTGVANEMRLFNAFYHPYFMAQRCLGYLGIASDYLRYAGMDANSEVYISGVNIKAPIRVTERLFDCIQYTFEASRKRLLPDVSLQSGLIRFTHKGITRKGFIFSLVKNEAMEAKSEWKLKAVL